MPDLRQMEFGEILDGTFTLFRRHFTLFLRLSLIVMTAPVAFGIYFRLRFVSGVTPDQVASAFQDNPVSAILLGILFVVLYGVGALFLTAGSVRIISDSYLGHTPRLQDALGLGAAKFWPLFLVGFGKGLLLLLIALGGGVAIALLSVAGGVAGGLVGGLVIFAGSVGLIWLVVWVFCGYMVTTPVVVLENLGDSFEAFGRSWSLTRSMRGRVLGLVLVGWIIASLLPALFLGVVGATIGGPLVGVNPVFIIVNTVVPVMFAPILPCILTLLYYDLRVRREAFDLQLLQQQLESL
ncbi:MAG TPA: hypothetical protein VMH88_14510 [Gemmatimonadales bacterium]|nr:hypothetical protein [Gemmatimonadales bacterium]